MSGGAWQKSIMVWLEKHLDDPCIKVVPLEGYTEMCLRSANGCRLIAFTYAYSIFLRNSVVICDRHGLQQAASMT